MGRESKARNRAPAETPAAGPALSEAQLEQIHDDTARMDKSERIAYWDKRQSKNFYSAEPYGPDVVMCPNDQSHGALQMHGSGTALICQQRSPGDRNSFCSGTMPVSV